MYPPCLVLSNNYIDYFLFFTCILSARNTGLTDIFVYQFF